MKEVKTSLDVRALLEKFESKAPEIVFEWKDAETEAEGWVVINSLRGGAAGGGTRMRKGLNKHEVLSLAKTMEVKFTVSGPAIGGAKSGINFDPNDPRKEGVLKRWYKAVIPILKAYYGTGGDLNIDEIHEVIPITEEYGLWHPQEGVVNGYYGTTEAEKVHRIGDLRLGVSKIIDEPIYTPALKMKYTTADMITGYGVSESVRHYYDLWGGSVQGKRVVVQGWGNVGAAAGFYLAQAGAKVVGIIDGGGGVINQAGFSEEQVGELMMNRKNRLLTSPDIISFEEANQKIWDLEAEILIPAAGSRMVSMENLKRLKGLEVISCGANVPFQDEEIFLGNTLDKVDELVSIIPDFIANCGMARVFAYLMSGKVDVTDQAIFSDTSNVIKKALEQIQAIHPNKTGIAKASLAHSISQLI